MCCHPGVLVLAVESKPYVSRMPIVAIGLALLFAAQVIPQVPMQLTSSADAAGAATSTKFGASGAHTWDNYNFNTDVGSDPTLGTLCGCEPTMGVDWVHGNGKDALYQAMDTTVCASWDDAVPIGVRPPGAFRNCNSPFNMALNLALPNVDPILYTDFDGGRTFAGGLIINPVPPSPVPPPPPIPDPCSLLAPPASCTYGCSQLSYTDTNDGVDPTTGEPNAAWRPVAEACALPGWDHETIAAGPWAYPPPSWAVPGSRAVYYCAQYGAITCWTSYDGGITFVQNGGDLGQTDPGNGDCHGIHGHLRISRMYNGDDIGEPGSDAPDGMGYVYLPNKACLPDSAAFATCAPAPAPASCMTAFMYSKDNALSWTLVLRPDTSPPQPCTGGGPLLRPGHFDPSIAPSLDNGWIYLGQGEASAVAGAPAGAYVAMSKTNGATWEDVGTGNGACPGTKYFNVGALVGVQQATFPEMIAGDDDRAAYAFLGSTESADDYDMCGGGASAHIWHLYVAFTYDAGKTWVVDKATTDPVQRGGIWPYGGNDICRNHLDFNDIVTDKEGRVMVSYTDGCVGACAGPAGTVGASTSSHPLIARQRTGRGLLAAYDIPDPPLLPLDDTESGPSAGGPTQYGPPEEGVSDTTDRDEDGVYDYKDNCITVPNSDQTDTDRDTVGNECDADDDGDGVLDGADLCPDNADPRQLDRDLDGVGDACDVDADDDAILNAADNCWSDVNADQKDMDADGFGDLCDGDRDGDGVPNGSDDFADDISRWNDELAAGASNPLAGVEGQKPMTGVGSAGAGSSSSMMVIAVAAILVLASLVALMLLMMRRPAK